jgi:hypothetical protein
LPAKSDQRFEDHRPAKALAYFGHPSPASGCHFLVGEEPEERLFESLRVLGGHGQPEMFFLDQLAERIAFGGHDR